MNNASKSCVLGLLAAACSPALWAGPAGQWNPSHISAVTVYQGSATVQRTVQVDAGASEVRLACLPAGLDLAGLQVQAAAGIQVGDISVQQLARHELGTLCSSPLEAQIRILEDEIAKLVAEAEGLAYVTRYLQTVITPDTDKRGRITADEVGTMAQVLGSRGESAKLRLYQIEREQERLKQELTPLLSERDRTGSEHTQVSTVRIAIDAARSDVLQLSYQVNGPSWQPVYRASLQSDTRQLRLARMAQVQQATGEHWDGVKLRLSTGQPRAVTQGPLPHPRRIGLFNPVVRAEKQAAREVMYAVAAAPAPASADSTQRFRIAVDDGAYATEFAVPQPVNLPSGNEQIALQLDSHEIRPELWARTTPALDSQAYLVAGFRLPEGVWLKGPVQLYRDAVYAGKGQLDGKRLEQYGLAFGLDEKVVVRVSRPEGQDGTSGLIGSRNQRIEERSYTIENQHSKPLRVEVLDTAPIAEDEDVKIASVFTPKASTEAWQGTKGLIAWQLELPAGASREFAVKHTLSWPRDKELQER